MLQNSLLAFGFYSSFFLFFSNVSKPIFIIYLSSAEMSIAGQGSHQIHAQRHTNTESIYAMAPDSVHQKKHKSRSRKKRRTQDSSSESSSDSSDHEEYGSQEKVEHNKPFNTNESVSIDDIDIDSEDEKSQDRQAPGFSEEAVKKLEAIKFTKTDHLPIDEARKTVKSDRQELEQLFLAQMASSFAGELDELRQKLDFTDKSIVLLAKTLQSGSNMFDNETLEALLKE